MKIAALLNVHTPDKVIIDTLESIFCYLTRDVLVLIDGASESKFKDFDLPVPSVVGFKHGCPKSPYRNVALGLKCLYESNPEADWYCYTEYDVLFTSSRIRSQLLMADEMDVWMLGNDGHVDEVTLPLVSSLVGEPLKQSYYLLGCCQFFRNKYLRKLYEIDFFDRFLNLTNEFTEGYMPCYSGYDVSEHLYPSLCRHFGGNIGVLASYDEMGRWHGAYQYYPVRWRPELNPETEEFPDASIMHPLKNYDHPFREEHRKIRKELIHGNHNLGLKGAGRSNGRVLETCG